MGGFGSGPRNPAAFKLAEDRLAWERQPRESAKAFQAFQAYRDLGADRSHLEVGRGLSKSLALMKRWSACWGWRVRVRAWDDHLDEQGRSAHVRKVQEASERHAKAANVMFGIGLAELSKLAGVVSRRTRRSKASLALLAERLERAATPGECTEIEQLMEQAQDSPLANSRGEIDIGHIRALVETGIKVERLILGEPGEISEDRPASWVELVDLDDKDADEAPDEEW